MRFIRSSVRSSPVTRASAERKPEPKTDKDRVRHFWQDRTQLLHEMAAQASQDVSTMDKIARDDSAQLFQFFRAQCVHGKSGPAAGPSAAPSPVVPGQGKGAGHPSA